MILSPDALSPLSKVFWLQLGTAVLSGGAIGVERQLRGKVAGVRTSILICLGTELFVAMGSSFPTEHADPTRVLGQVVTGIGFLGAGVIISRQGRLVGVTTAALIWMLASLGSLIGLGYLGAALVITVVTLFVLTGIEKLDRFRDAAAKKRGSGSFTAETGEGEV